MASKSIIFNDFFLNFGMKKTCNISVRSSLIHKKSIHFLVSEIYYIQSLVLQCMDNTLVSIIQSFASENFIMEAVLSC